MKKIKAGVATLIFIACSSYAESESLTSSFSMGLGATYAPEYTGSDKYETNVMPYVEWTKGDWFLNTEKGLGFNHQFDNGIYLGQSLGYSAGRTDSDPSWIQEGSKKLKGMGKINGAMMSTTTAGWWVTPWVGFEGNIVAPLTDSQGMQYNVKVNLVLFNSDVDTLSLSTEGQYGDARFNNTWFGVTERQSTASGFREYNPGKGVSSIDYTINWQHAFSDTWTGYADLRYATLLGRVNKSPIVNKDDYLTFTIGALYTF